MHFQRSASNPIILPGQFPWRMAAVFNPAVIFDQGRYWLFERAAGGLRPFICAIGGLVSNDGVHFQHFSDQPVLTPQMCGSQHGSVQDPRVVELDGRYWMTFAYRPFAWSSHPTGVGVPESHETDFPGVPRAAPAPGGAGNSANVTGGRPDNLTRIGLAVSDDLRTWRFDSFVSPPTLDDRNGILFPEKVAGAGGTKARYALLRRPLPYVGERYGTPGPAIWISYSDDLRNWGEPRLLAKPAFPWEDNRIGGSTPPVKTRDGWLLLYHGVQTLDASVNRVVYRVGALLLDLENPEKVLARTAEPIMAPDEYYERFGLYIPNVIFPTGLVLRDGMLQVYYGCCDTCIALATAPLAEVLGAMA